MKYFAMVAFAIITFSCFNNYLSAQTLDIKVGESENKTGFPVLEADGLFYTVRSTPKSFTVEKFDQGLKKVGETSFDRQKYNGVFNVVGEYIHTNKWVYCKGTTWEKKPGTALSSCRNSIHLVYLISLFQFISQSDKEFIYRVMILTVLS